MRRVSMGELNWLKDQIRLLQKSRLTNTEERKLVFLVLEKIVEFMERG